MTTTTQSLKYFASPNDFQSKGLELARLAHKSVEDIRIQLGNSFDSTRQMALEYFGVDILIEDDIQRKWLPRRFSGKKYDTNYAAVRAEIISRIIPGHPVKAAEFRKKHGLIS